MFELRAQNSKVTDMLLYGSIAEWGRVRSEDFVKAIANAKSQGYEKVKLRINSGGGSIWEGLAIIAEMNGQGIDIEAQVDGVAASMAAVIVASSRRSTMVKGSRLMIHQGTGGVRGTAKQIKVYGELVESLDRTLAEVFATKTGKDAKWILENWMAEGKDTWFTAEQALKEKLIDEVISGNVVPMPNEEKASFYEMAAYYTEQLDTTENAMDKATKEKLIAKLGLKAEATDAEILTAVEALEKKSAEDKKKTAREKLIAKFKLKAEATDAEIIAAAEAEAAGTSTKPEGEKSELVEGVMMLAKERGLTDEKKLEAIKNVATKVGIQAAIELLPEAKGKEEPGSLKELIAELKSQGTGGTAVSAERKDWNLTKWSKDDPTGLSKMAKEKPKEYIALFKAEHGYEPTEKEINELTSFKN